MKEFNKFINAIKKNILNYQCLYHRLLLDIKYNFNNIIITRKSSKNVQFITYMESILNNIDEYIKNKKVLIYTELNWERDIRYEKPSKFLEKYNDKNDIYWFFTSHKVNQTFIEVLYDNENKIFIFSKDNIIINNETYKIKNFIQEKFLILNLINKNHDFTQESNFTISKNKFLYNINWNNLTIKKISLIQKKFLDNLYENKNNENYKFILKNIEKYLELSHTFFFFTVNSFNYKYSTKIKNINEEKRYEYVSQKYFKYSDNYKHNEDGWIVIYLNYSSGHFKNNFDYKKDIINLVKKIRKYNQKNQIRIRFHPKETIVYIVDVMTAARSVDENVKVDTSDYKKLIDKVYCVFIQNSKIIIDLWNDGIPVFSTEIISINIFPLKEEFCKYHILENIKKYRNELPNRRNLLKKYYKNIIFYEELFENHKYINNLLKNQV